MRIICGGRDHIYEIFTKHLSRQLLLSESVNEPHNIQLITQFWLNTNHCTYLELFFFCTNTVFTRLTPAIGKSVLCIWPILQRHWDICHWPQRTSLRSCQVWGLSALCLSSPPGPSTKQTHSLPLRSAPHSLPQHCVLTHPLSPPQCIIVSSHRAQVTTIV